MEICSVRREMGCGGVEGIGREGEKEKGSMYILTVLYIHSTVDTTYCTVHKYVLYRYTEQYIICLAPFAIIIQLDGQS